MTDRRTVLTVIYLLGACTLLLVTGSMGLTYVVIHQAAAGGPVDPTSVAVLSGVTGLAGTCVGALASMLVSTRSAPPGEIDQPPESAPRRVKGGTIPSGGSRAPEQGQPRPPKGGGQP